MNDFFPEIEKPSARARHESAENEAKERLPVVLKRLRQLVKDFHDDLISQEEFIRRRAEFVGKDLAEPVAHCLHMEHHDVPGIRVVSSRFIAYD